MTSMTGTARAALAARELRFVACVKHYCMLHSSRALVIRQHGRYVLEETNRMSQLQLQRVWQAKPTVHCRSLLNENKVLTYVLRKFRSQVKMINVQLAIA